MHSTHVCLALAAVLGAARGARAEEIERPPLPESLLTESATDLDATEAGEVEIEGNLATLGARRGGARALQTSLEIEWRALEQAGVRLEPTFARADGGSTFGLEGGLALGLLHDFAHDFHLQAELLGHTIEHARVLEPGSSELPLAADLLAAWRVDRLTLRATVGGEAGASFAHAPLHTDLALLTGFVRDARYGFVALEARSDWAREAPLVLAPDLVADVTSLGLPFRFGIALPVNVGADASRPSYGLFVRVMLMTAREAEYGRTGVVAETERK